MAKALLLVVLLSAAISVSADMASARGFLQYIRTYKKSYAAAEFPVRYRNYQASMARVAERNQKSMSIGGATYAPNMFSDLSPEEFRATMLMKNPIKKADERVAGVETIKPTISTADLPTSFDWREQGAVTAVKNQAQCGSCWAFSATENIESVNILKGLFTNETINLSPQQIVDCDTTDDGCNGGNTNTAFEYVIGAGGMENISEYPYEGVDGQCAFNKADVVASISSFKYATEFYSEDTLQANLVSWSPLSVCVDASAWQDYSSGVMTWEECAWVNQLDHCVQLVGYEKTAPKPYYIVRNSWTEQWGIDGYIWLAIGGDTCGIAHDATTAVV